MSRDGAQYLLLALRKQEAQARLVPLDMAILTAIREGRLKASISLPFLSTVRVGIASSLQQDRATAVQLSQDVDLSLRRLLYVKAWEPGACADELDRVSALLADGLTPPQIETLVLEMLAAGRREGWLPRY